MKYLKIDFSKCKGHPNCCCPSDFLLACLEGRTVKYPNNGWAEAKIIADIKASCPRGAVYSEDAYPVEPCAAA